MKKDKHYIGNRENEDEFMENEDKDEQIERELNDPPSEGFPKP